MGWNHSCRNVFNSTRATCDDESLPTQSQSLRILIVRLGAMGDILHALPAVTALRAALDRKSSCQPDRLGDRAAVGAASVRRILRTKLRDADRRCLSWIDCIACLRNNGPADRFSLSTLREIRQLRSELRAQHYDICIDLQGAIRSAWIGRMAKAPRMIGEADPREPLARWLFRERIATTGVHVVEQANEVVNAVLQGEPALSSACIARRSCCGKLV